MPAGLSYDIVTGMRLVALGELPLGVTLSRRATDAVADIRSDLAAVADHERSVLDRTPRGDWRWWTWAGTRVNRTLTAWLPDLVDPTQRVGDLWLRLHPDLTARVIRDRLAAAWDSDEPRPLPAVDPDALRGLKFSEALPADLAADSAARRLVDAEHATDVLRRPTRE